MSILEIKEPPQKYKIPRRLFRQGISGDTTKRGLKEASGSITKRMTKTTA